MDFVIDQFTEMTGDLEPGMEARVSYASLNGVMVAMRIEPDRELAPMTDSSPAVEHGGVAKTVPPDAPVITLVGLCDKNDSTDACKTVVTRAEFERVVNAVAPKPSPDAVGDIAQRYTILLLTANKAQNLGLDKGPEFEEKMKLARMQVASQLLQEHLEQEAGSISDKDVEAYYNRNASAYEEAFLEQIAIPKQGAVGSSKAFSGFGKSWGMAEYEAESIHKRAAGGEDFHNLQREADKLASDKDKSDSNPETLKKVRRSELPPQYATLIFDLKPGEVSPLVSDTSGYVIYKMVRKQTVPLNEVKGEIYETLRREFLKETLRSVQQSATPIYDQAYFPPTGGATTAEAPTRPASSASPPRR